MNLSSTDDEALAEDEAAFEMSGQTLMEVPTELVPAVRELLAKHKALSSKAREVTLF